jgi:hypothetical protein
LKTIDKTWQEAANEAISQIYTMTVEKNFDQSQTLVRFMRHRFDQEIEKFESNQSMNIETDGSVWEFIGRHALRLLYLEGYYPAQNYVVELLIRKQKDYGPENIARFGNVGLLIRMHDKIARLENILERSKNNFNTAVSVNMVEDETIIDTLIDIIGYSSIAIMWSTIDAEGQRAFLYPVAD